LELIPLADELVGRVRVLETKVEDHDKKLDKQQERNDIQTELNTILKMNVEQMKRFGETLDKIDINLTNLNNNQINLGQRVTEIEGFLSNQKFSITDVLKYIGAIVGGLIVGYISTKIGK
jgi:predicted Holliday junction resolvase-like endonuclease